MSHRTNLARTLFGVLAVGVGGVTTGGTLTGCGAPTNVNNCVLRQGVVPTTAVASHTAAAPGNQATFDVGFVDVAPGCAVPAYIANPASFTWVSSDPVNAPISNVAATAGVATCVGTTMIPATISVSSEANVQVATLTCQ
jgi:hypothetical protein